MTDVQSQVALARCLAPSRYSTTPTPALHARTANRIQSRESNNRMSISIARPRDTVLWLAITRQDSPPIAFATLPCRTNHGLPVTLTPSPSLTPRSCELSCHRNIAEFQDEPSAFINTKSNARRHPNQRTDRQLLLQSLQRQRINTRTVSGIL